MKPTIPEVLTLFYDYQHRPAAWGSLHAVLEDGNVSTRAVRHAMRSACAYKDAEGVTLALLLVCMSQTQRSKLPSAVSFTDSKRIRDLRKLLDDRREAYRSAEMARRDAILRALLGQWVSELTPFVMTDIDGTILGLGDGFNIIVPAD